MIKRLRSTESSTRLSIMNRISSRIWSTHNSALFCSHTLRLDCSWHYQVPRISYWRRTPHSSACARAKQHPSYIKFAHERDKLVPLKDLIENHWIAGQSSLLNPVSFLVQWWQKCTIVEPENFGCWEKEYLPTSEVQSPLNLKTRTAATIPVCWHYCYLLTGSASCRPKERSVGAIPSAGNEPGKRNLLLTREGYPHGQYLFTLFKHLHMMHKKWASFNDPSLGRYCKIIRILHFWYAINFFFKQNDLFNELLLTVLAASTGRNMLRQPRIYCTKPEINISNIATNE